MEVIMGKATRVFWRQRLIPLGGASKHKSTMPQEITVNPTLHCNSCTKPIACHYMIWPGWENTQTPHFPSCFPALKKGTHRCSWNDILGDRAGWPLKVHPWWIWPLVCSTLEAVNRNRGLVVTLTNPTIVPYLGIQTLALSKQWIL